MDSIVKKIQKLLALASSANEHEAMAAMAKAQEMLAQHDLDMTEVHAHSDEPDEPVTKGKVAPGRKLPPNGRSLSSPPLPGPITARRTDTTVPFT